MWKSGALFEKFYVNNCMARNIFTASQGFQQELQNPKVKFRHL